jgi:hypothetical protein
LIEEKKDRSATGSDCSQLDGDMQEYQEYDIITQDEMVIKGRKRKARFVNKRFCATSGKSWTQNEMSLQMRTRSDQYSKTWSKGRI